MNTEESPQIPLPVGPAALAIARSIAVTVMLLVRHRIRVPRENIGLRITFADGATAPVFRETAIDGVGALDPCILVVVFTLRGVRGRGHALFRCESLLNTILFAGFPGLITKLWLAHDQYGAYRGLYEWDTPARAEAYARSLWRILALVSVPGSIGYHIIPGRRRTELFAAGPAQQADDDEGAWWRVTGLSPA
ncbi:hypothetical protein [Nocardia aurantiaca]|uniref:Uncharacterized protein n=1 Tax=Nocardia aurantiaca TaxID=2675850 RepID=A0A6I3KY00_9NOCA|nr:hypothetical protein [Nocardia aurantiaca]MTE14291.1 hypothetical protein [Nocardia aurantiaca]